MGCIHLRGHQSRQRDRAGTDHPPGRGGAGFQGTHPETGGPGLGRLCPDRDRHCAVDLLAWYFLAPALPAGADVNSLDARPDQHGGGAGHRLPVRDGAGDTDRGHGRLRPRSRAGRTVPQFRSTGARRQR